MPHSYSRVFEDGRFKCVFSRYDTNQILEDQFINRIGGKNVYDPHEHTFCLQCPIPSEAVPQHATKIFFLLISDNNSTITINISICRSYQSSYDFLNSQIYLNNPKRFSTRNGNREVKSKGVGACTQTAHHDAQFPLWIDYHHQMGVDHFYIYDHALSNETRLHRSLQYYIDQNLITIIPWHMDYWNGFEHHSTDWVKHQIWSQNDCIRRYGHLHSWLLISDVDEFVLPMDPFDDFVDLLDFIPSNYCALQILHFGFHGLENETLISAKDRPKKYVHRDRQNDQRNVRSKNFVRPKLVNYFSVHQVTQSVDNSPVYYADVEKHARLHHYRKELISGDQLKNSVIDNRFIHLLNKMKNNSI